MFTKYQQFSKSITIITLILSLSVGLFALPLSARAQGTVPGNTTFDYHAIMGNMKDFTLDKLATLVAKQILHQITASVVNWINSGFKGSPSFLQDPAGFFLDAADQLTGVFLSNGGPLSSLCSPFNIDIRLSLSLRFSGMSTKRYSCTLSSIIKNSKNSHISVGASLNVNGKNVSNAGVSTNGNTIDGFMNGDFTQGGWPAFISMSTGPQNNPYSAYLSAESDLQTQIDSKHASIRADLSLGNGFMSWQDCQTLATVDPNASDGMDQVAQADAITYGNTSVSTNMNKDGTITYQSCKTQTPGSVISGTLQKQLNVPADELELANNINAVVNALMSQMITQMLSKGLGALSSSGGGSRSFTTQVISDSTSNNSPNSKQARAQALSSVNANIQSIQSSLTKYDQANTLIQNNLTAYATARACFIKKIASYNSSPMDKVYAASEINLANAEIAKIDAAVSTQVSPLADSLASKKQALADELSKLQIASVDFSHFLSTTTTMTSASQIDSQVQGFESYIQSISDGAHVSSDKNTVDQDYQDAKSQAAIFTKDATQYQTDCSRLHSSI